MSSDAAVRRELLKFVFMVTISCANVVKMVSTSVWKEKFLFGFKE